MSKIAYQIAILGDNSLNIQTRLKDDIITRVSELGINANTHIKIIDVNNIDSYTKAAPMVAVFFGGLALPEEEISAVKKLMDEGFVVIPIVDNLLNYQSLVPSCLFAINGLELNQASGGISSVTSLILELLNLLRKSRKLFISYRRVESRAVAIQLYEHLDSCGFDVFLDTVSIRPGDAFQEVLWHKLGDTDVIILLDTPGYLESRWTVDELARASAMSIGIIQVIWPNHDPNPASSLCDRLYLQKDDISDVNGRLLIDSAVSKITEFSETLRARSLSARYHNLVGELRIAAAELNIEIILQPQHFVVLRTNSKEIVLIPTVGVPEALRFQEFEEMLDALDGYSADTAVLIYDDNSIREKWKRHLQWLDSQLRIKSIRISNFKQWLNTI